MRIVFPYGIRFIEDGRLETFPAAEVFISKHGKEITAIFQVDSGATISVLPRGDAEALDIKLDRGERVALRGIGNDLIFGFRDVVTLEFSEKRLKIPVIFLESYTAPRILGREGIFANFGIMFDEVKNRTAFLDQRERKIIDRLF